MTTSILIVFIILGVSIVLFVTELFPVDKVAFFILISLMFSKTVSPEEAVSGFSNPAVITILALMILATCLEKNGVISWLADRMKFLANTSLWILIPVFMIVVGGISSFISTTAVVIVFVKLLHELASKFQLNQTKLLLPISFAGILGGSCTLMGTSTVLLVSDIAENAGMGSFGFFEFSTIGLIFFGVALPIIVVLSIWILPSRSKKPLAEDFDLEDYITTITILPNSPLDGELIKDSFLHDNETHTLLRLKRGNEIVQRPGKYIRLQAGDRLLLQSDVEDLMQLQEKYQFDLLGSYDWQDDDEREQGLEWYELLVLPNSHLLGQTLRQLRKQSNPKMFPLGVKKHENIIDKTGLFKRFGTRLFLEVGDRILVGGEKEYMDQATRRNGTLVLRSITGPNTIPAHKKLIAVGSLLLVVVLAATNVLGIMESALMGVAVCLFTGTLSFNDAYQGINWQVIFLLAGMIPLGLAMTNTGADQLIAQSLQSLLSGMSAEGILSTLFLFTMLMSGFVSNNATAIILAPIALSLANNMGQPAKPFLYAIMFAANFSFFTPIGYQTNAIIYGMGDYKFRHFLIIGGVVSLILWGTATLLLPSL